MLVFHKHLPVIPARPVKWFSAKEFRHSGTGRQAGLGLAGGFFAALLLVASLAFGSVAAHIASLPPMGQPGPADAWRVRHRLHPLPSWPVRRVR